MIYYKRLLFYMLVLAGADSYAQDCKCLNMSIIKNESTSEKKDQIKVRIKNNCIVRKWFYTPAFWIRVTEEDSITTRTSVVHKLHNNLPEFILFKWKEEKVLTFDPDVDINNKKFTISYENTDHVYPSRLFGSKTYLCSKEMENK